jgi:F-type H+-transporting ATPase subunit b
MDSTVLLTVAAGGEHPLIDLDLTVLVQFGLFLLTAIIANQLLFKPYLKMRDERSAGIEGARSEADRLSAEADARLTDYEEKLAAARNRANEQRRSIRTEAADHQREVTDKARAEAQKSFTEARTKVEKETEKARGELMPKADELAGDIVSKLLGRKVA